MPDPLIKFHRVSFRYSGVKQHIIQNCSFIVNTGDRFVLQGESGAGKTTLFRLLLGFELPQNGTIRYQGNKLTGETVHQLRRNTAWLPQDLNIGAGRVNEVFEFPFTFKANTKPPSDAKIKSTMQQLGLPPALLDKDFSQLSTGQRQRVGLALCYLLEKPILLLDEPTSALDSASKQKAANLLFDDEKRTIISTSHDAEWIAHFDSVIELNGNEA